MKNITTEKPAQGVVDFFSSLAFWWRFIIGGALLFVAGGFIWRTLENSTGWEFTKALGRAARGALWRLLFGG